MTLAFHVLGEVSAEIDGTPFSLGHVQQLSVLAVLLIEAGRPVPADVLMDRAWGQRASSRTRSTLYSYISQLRGLLGRASNVRIDRTPNGYVLNAPQEAVDVHRFNQLLAKARETDEVNKAVAVLDTALALWRGEALSRLDSPWLNTVRNHLTDLRFTCELDRDDLRLNRGEHRTLLPDLMLRAKTYPLDERVSSQLILALQRSGRRAEALAEFHRIRETLAEELGLDTGPELVELHEAILRNTGQQWHTTPNWSARPQQLPPDIPAFVGREPELATLTRTSALDNAPIVLHGLAGVGKTALALHWSHKINTRFPDGSLYADLQGFGPTDHPTTPTDVLASFLRTIGIKDQDTPPTLNERAALFRALTATRRYLVILDNAATEEQIRPLLLGPTPSQILITSRNPLTGLVALNGAHSITVDAFSPTDSRNLLKKLLGKKRLTPEPTGTEELIQACGGLPLALRVSSAILVMNPNITITDMATRLKRNNPLDHLQINGDARANVRLAFDWSYRSLTPQERALLKTIATTQTTNITVDQAAKSMSCGPPTAQTVLDRLVAVGLLATRDQHRYGYNPLLRAYARLTQAA